MPTIQEPNIDESFDGEDKDGEEDIERTAHNDDASTGGRKGAFGGGSRGRGRGSAAHSRRTDLSGTITKHSLMTKVRELSSCTNIVSKKYHRLMQYFFIKNFIVSVFHYHVFFI